MRNHIKFVNLTRNPEETLNAISLSRKLTAMVNDLVELEGRSIELDGMSWGTMVSVPQREIDNEAWSYTTFAQSELATIANSLKAGRSRLFHEVPVVPLENIARLGPYHMQIKGKGTGLFDIAETDDPLWPGIPALWHHRNERETTIRVATNARLERRVDADEESLERMLQRRGRLHLASELRTTTQKLGGVLTDSTAVGVRSWITILMRIPRPGKEEALCLWLNSTLGILTRIVHGNRPYLGRSGLTHELAKTLPVLDVDSLTDMQLKAAERLFEELQDTPLQAVMQLASDPARQLIDERLGGEILGIDPSQLRDIATSLALEPRVHGGKSAQILTRSIAPTDVKE